MVEELLFHGADVNASFGDKQINFPPSIAFALRDLKLVFKNY